MAEQSTGTEPDLSANKQPSSQPPKPNPSLDSGVIPKINAETAVDESSQEIPKDDNFDVSTLHPVAAMSLLGAGLEALVTMTGEIPPTPPVSRPTTPSLRELRTPPIGLRPVTPPSAVPSADIKRLSFQDTQIGSPEAHIEEPTVVDADIRAQQEVIARKFFSKSPPAISIPEYLARLHRYCPMSTAVYLAAGVYMHRLAIELRIVPVTARTVHRLLLASLRVAMKALEDLSYPHKRFSGVGGVKEEELAKLEISLCYLMEFELKVDCALLFEKAKAWLELGRMGQAGMKLTLPVRNAKADRRKTVG